MVSGMIGSNRPPVRCRPPMKPAELRHPLTIRLKGRTLEDVKAVQVSTFVYAGGSCQHLLYSDGYND